MSPYSYVVHVEVDDAQTAEAFVAWLSGGHLAAVVRGGALSGEVVALEGAPAHRLEVRYRFATAEDFTRYEATAAPALREEGRRLFPPERGVRMRRSTGTVLFSSP